MAAPPLEASKDCYMKKKLLVLLIAVIPTLMPNLVFAVAIELPVGDICHWSWVHVWWVDCWLVVDRCALRLERNPDEKETTSTTNYCSIHINTKLGICDSDWCRGMLWRDGLCAMCYLRYGDADVWLSWSRYGALYDLLIPLRDFVCIPHVPRLEAYKDCYKKYESTDYLTLY